MKNLMIKGCLILWDSLSNHMRLLQAQESSLISDKGSGPKIIKLSEIQFKW